MLLSANQPPPLFDLQTKVVRLLPSAESGDNSIDWSSDDRMLYVQKRADTVGRLERIEVATGRRLARELRPLLLMS